MEIKLYNRDGGDLRLRYLGGKYWTFISDRPEYFEKFCRFILAEDNKTIEDFDPPGGPYLCLGQKIEKYRLIKIYENLILELEEIK